MFIKKQLLSRPELRVTEDMVQAAFEDAGTPEDVHSWFNDKVYQRDVRKYWGYYRVDKEDDILRIAIWSRQNVIIRSKPDVYIFIDKKNNYTSYITSSGKWSTATLEYLYQYWMIKPPSPAYRWRAEGNYISKKDNKLIGSFVATVIGDYKGIGSAYHENGTRARRNIVKDARELVYAFQSKKMDERRYCRHKRETDEIDAVMNQVDNAIPEDIESWLIREGIQRHYGIMQPREKGKSYRLTRCSSCGEFFELDKEYAKVNYQGECRCCGTPLILKDWNRQQILSSSDRILIVQRMLDGDGYVIRRFWASVKWEKKDWYKPVVTTFRESFRKPFGGINHELYEWGRYKDGTIRWCHASVKPFSYTTPDIGNGVVYPYNLNEVFASKPWGKWDLKQIFCGVHHEESFSKPYFTKYTWVESVVRKLIIYPGIEYMNKAGLKRLTMETIHGHESREVVNSEGKTLKDYLRIDGNSLARLKKLNGGYHMLRALQHACNTGEKVSDETLIFISNRHISIVDDLAVLRTGLSMNKAVNYFLRQININNWSFNDFRTTYNDYLTMAEQRGMDITDDIVRANRKMKELHDRYTEEANARKNKEEDMKADMKFKRIKRDYKTNVKRFGYEWKKEGMVIVVPRKASDIKYEGRTLHHCVGTRGYIERMDEGRSFIVFLRRKKEADKPYYTIEVSREGHIKQFYSAYDRQPDKEKIEKLLKKWSKDVKRRADEEFAAIEAKENMKDICKEQKLLATA